MGVSTVKAYHREIRNEILSRASKVNSPPSHGSTYAGTTKLMYPLRGAAYGEIARMWVARHPDLTPAQYRALLDSLARGESFSEFILAGILLRAMPRLRQTIDPPHLAVWLERAEGWAEVDSICQSVFGAAELLADWRRWRAFLRSLSVSDNVHLRRASLVLLTGPVRESADARLAAVAFANIERLQHEKHILITKAISWLLRALIKHHRVEVEAYLQANESQLPKVALRETRIKLKTGTKSGRSRRAK